MGTVHLTNSHHGLYCRRQKPAYARIEITVDMLKGLPMLPEDHWRSKPRASYVAMHRAMLRACMSLGDINAVVAIPYDATVPCLRIPGRVWGEFSLGAPNHLILTFSHDTRKHNAAFNHLYQWLEELVPPDRVGDPEWVAFEKKWSDTRRWERFFRSRLKGICEQRCAQARALRIEADKNEALATQIENALK